MLLQNLRRGTIIALLAALLVVAGAQEALAQSWSWNGSWNGSGGWGSWQSSSGSGGWSGSNTGGNGSWDWSWTPGTGSSGSSGSNTGGSSGSGGTSSGSWSWSGSIGWGWSVTPSRPAPSPQPAPQPAPDPVTPPTPPTTGTPGASPSEEQYLVDAANAERAAHGRAPLATHSTLTSLARTKARDMAVNGYFDHVSPTLGTARDQMLAAGLNPKYWGENIGMGGSVQTIHRAFMESPGHRANILSAGFTHMGAGVVRQGGRIWVAEMFMQPR